MGRPGGKFQCGRFRLAAALVLFCAVPPAPTFAAEPPSADELRVLREQARAFEHGEGVPKDTGQAVKLYCDGARAGDLEAQYNLGWMYANGRGMPRDDALAAFFFHLAASQGHTQSLRMLRFVGPAATEPPPCMQEPKVPDPHGDATDIEFSTEKQRLMAELVRRLAPEYGIIPRLALAVASTESNFNPVAVSHKNAQGLMQLIPETAARFNVRKPFDPEQNVRGGLAYLRWLLAYFRGDVALVAAGYNAGEGAVNRYRGIPPYPETRHYVKRILEVFRHQEHPFDAAITDPSPELEKILHRKLRVKS
ncbi:MAG: transglycosylase SLT domain-containing protein [Gammaproteobacteria bacterium]|nr:lytic transglycosylase [Rhodocyclaceae bacterium]MBU3910115.1 transglycosylase SLT domain-containing protein [Gammaproteobacteria bacterium]MBU3989883.1 transglycosylase SLT domain-containing protein [Gammaproteobacteria bacterium]MBU4006123.1 transglycosylase SLT domain-containing protein [Gammaproteobacteria bacterium]MBU4022577.1 transglycosylase SLT domain-containing protein [Gammaproteobacteria bacterium]